MVRVSLPPQQHVRSFHQLNVTCFCWLVLFHWAMVVSCLLCDESSQLYLESTSSQKNVLMALWGLEAANSWFTGSFFPITLAAMGFCSDKTEAADKITEKQTAQQQRRIWNVNQVSPQFNSFMSFCTFHFLISFTAFKAERTQIHRHLSNPSQSESVHVLTFKPCFCDLLHVCLVY